MMVTKVSTDFDCNAISVWRWLCSLHLRQGFEKIHGKIHRKIQNRNCLNRHPTRAYTQAKCKRHASDTRADRHSKNPVLPFPYRLHLRTVECAGVTLTCEAILHHAFLPNLCEVDIRVADDHIDIKSSAHIPFPALRCLSLNCESMTTAIEFVKSMIHSVLLMLFMVRIEDPPSSAQLGRMFSLLSAQSSFVHLTDIHFCHPEFIDDQEDFLPLLDAQDFEPLLKFMHMESIYIETQCSITNFDDELLKAMAMSWPNLHRLCLTNGWGESFPSRCTLHGILHLGQHCPNLLFLRIGFQASAEICWNGRPGGGVVNEYMETLEVVQSPIADPRAVASFLSDVFPRLTSIDAWDNFNPNDLTEVEYQKRWQEAIQLYHVFVGIQNEERRWAASVATSMNYLQHNI